VAGAEAEDGRESEAEGVPLTITTAPALQPINYMIDNPIILAVDSSVEATGMILYQMSDDGKT